MNDAFGAHPGFEARLQRPTEERKFSSKKSFHRDLNKVNTVVIFQVQTSVQGLVLAWGQRWIGLAPALKSRSGVETDRR